MCPDLGKLSFRWGCIEQLFPDMVTSLPELHYPSEPSQDRGGHIADRPDVGPWKIRGGDMSRTRIGFADVEIDPTTADDTALDMAVKHCGVLKGRVTVAQSKLVTEIARRKSAEEAEATLKREQGITSHDAKDSAKLADTLDNHPELGEAVGAGDITPAHAKTIGEAEAEHPGASEELLPKAKNQNADQFKRSASDWRHRKDEEAGFDRDAIQRKKRKVSMWVRPEDGMGIIHGEFDPPTFKKAPGCARRIQRTQIPLRQRRRQPRTAHRDDPATSARRCIRRCLRRGSDGRRRSSQRSTRRHRRLRHRESSPRQRPLLRWHPDHGWSAETSCM